MERARRRAHRWLPRWPMPFSMRWVSGCEQSRSPRSGSRQVSPGRERLEFRDQIDKPGGYSYNRKRPKSNPAPKRFEDSPDIMFKASLDKILPTTVTGSLPRPSWYTENLGTRSFLDAMVTSRFREQYVDTLSVYLREQEVAGLDIVTDGDCRFDQDIGGQSWTSYPPHHMDGFEVTHPK